MCSRGCTRGRPAAELPNRRATNHLPWYTPDVRKTHCCAIAARGRQGRGEAPHLEGRAHGQGWPPGYGQICPRRHPDPPTAGDSP
jgi:hypothetical protein